MTRFVQIGDLHLGRQLHGVRLLEDQRHALAQVLSVIEREQPHALFVTGDVYDRAVPPAEAVRLLDDFLAEVVRELETPVVLIPGNHDSADRLAFGGRIFEGLHVAPAFDGAVASVRIGEALVHPLPYLDPPRVRAVLDEPSVRTHQDVMETVTSRVLADTPGPQVLVAHAFVAGGTTSESERLLSIGGADTVAAEVFEDFAYVALGHLHRPQSITPRIHYAGSLLRYSASEIEHDKSITVVDIEGDKLSVRYHPIEPRHQLRRIEGTLEEILDGPEGPAEDYVIVRLLDKGPVFEAMKRVRSIYPNALHIERPDVAFAGRVGVPDREARSLDPLELFQRFFEEVTDEPLSEQELAALRRVARCEEEA